MRNLRIEAGTDEGTLQRTIFEFSRRNIQVSELKYRRNSDSVTVDVSVEKQEDVNRVLKHLNRIYGVRGVQVLENTENME